MITREQLYELIWSTSVLAAAKQFGVSQVYLARVCRKMDIPRPPLGYPTLVRLGRAPPRPDLPKWRQGTPQVWAKGPAPKQPRPPRLHPPSQSDPRTRIIGKDIHPLATDAAKHFESATVDVETRYLVPRKKLMADLVTSKECMRKCLHFANALYHILESDGYGVVIAPAFESLIRIPIGNKDEHSAGVQVDSQKWSPLRPTVAYIFGVPIGLTVIELSEKQLMRYIGDGRFIPKHDYRPEDHAGPTWDCIKEIPTGRLKLVAYSPFHQIPWQKQWIEGPANLLDQQLDGILGELQSGAINLMKKLDAAGRYFE